MPCRCDYMEPNKQEREASRAASLLDELNSGNLNKDHYQGFHPDVYMKCSKKKADALVAELCSKLRGVNVREYSPEMQGWWAKHRKEDEMREVNENRAKFNDLSNKWKDSTKGFSSVSAICLNPYYLKIIAMGKGVVPLILESMSKEPDHWFAALCALTDEDPTSPGDNFQDATAKWLDWGLSRGYTTLVHEKDQ